MAPKKGPLHTKVELRRLPLLADKERQLAVIAEWMAEDHKNLLLLCDELGVPDTPARWYELALALARKQYAGFQERMPLNKWTIVTRGFLVVEIERLTVDVKKFPGHTVKWAANKVAKRPEWREFLGGAGANPGEALRAQYHLFSGSLYADTFRKAFRWHVHEDTVAQWEADQRNALLDPHGLKYL